MGRFVWIFAVATHSRGSRPSTNGATTVSAHLKSYAWFLGFLIATKVIVAPVAKQMGIPYIQDL